MRERLRPTFGGVTLWLSLMAAAPSSQAHDIALTIDAGLRTMSNSSQTQKAIFDTERGIGFGGGVTYDRGRRWRFGAELRRVGRDGERAFALDRTSQAFRLGHPLTLTLTEGLASACFRFRRVGPLSPYIGAGAGFVSWKESSTIAGVVEKESGTSALAEARLGVEREQGSFRYGIEGGITFTPNAVGVGGISKVYGESDLGGLYLVARLGFVRR